jgi:NAD(P)-dependent dehydrogenase (short-subunit alcohol dehydrogenase family)
VDALTRLTQPWRQTRGSTATAEAVIAQVLREHGRVDLVAHLAGMLEAIPVPEVNEEHWDQHMNVNVRPP